LPLHLAVGGIQIRHAGVNPASQIALYDGANWTSPGVGVQGSVRALAVYNGRLIVGGHLTEAGGLPVGRIAAWDGTAWAPLGAGVNGDVLSLAVFSGELYASGVF